VPNVSFHHPIMHIVFFGKTDRLASQPLNMRPEIQILPLDFLRLFLGDRMLLRWYMLLVRLPIICVVVLYIQVRQLAHQLLARRIVSLADLEGQNLATLPAVGVPRGGPSKPALARLAPANPRPHLVNHHALISTLEVRLAVGIEPKPQNHDYSHCTHYQYSACVTDTAGAPARYHSWPSRRPCV